MDGPCATQLTAAIACVDADPATCACYTQPFNETLINDFGGAYRMTMAFEIPGSDEFCDTANENVCIKLEASGECCCSTEIYDWLTCSFESDWSPAFGAGDCAFDQCGASGSEGGSSGGGSSMMIIIIAVAVTVLLCCCCCCCGCYYYRRNKRRAAEATANESTSKETKQGDESEHSWGDRDVESMGESIRKNNKNNKSKRNGYDRNTSHGSSDEESESRRDNRRGRGSKMNKSKSKRSNYDSDSSRDDDSMEDDSDDSSSKWSKRKGDGKSKKKLKKSKSRRGYSSNDDSDEYYSDQSESRRQSKRRGNGKKRSEDSDDYSDEEGLSFRPKKNKNRGRDDSERPTVEESVRQARSILKAVKKSEKSPDAVTVEVQQVMNSELSAMIAQLKEQKQEMERRLRESETEATRLRLEKEASQRHIVQLETKAMETQKTLQMTQSEARNLQANQTLHVASKEAETMKVSAELEQVRKERSEMSKMIQKLEEARDSMQDKLIQAKDEALVLRTENNEATKKIHEVEKDREELRTKLAQIQQTRSDIERRLKEAEKEADDLRTLKKAKGQEIREERASTHVRQSYVNEMEAERKDISRNLKRMENEKLQMIAMMEKLDSSRQRLDTLLEESPPFTAGDFDDQSISFQEATNMSSNNMSSNRSVNSSRSISDVRQQQQQQGNRGSSNPTSNNPSTPVRPSRYLQPTLATIQSPRNMIVASSPLGLPRPSSLKSLDQLTVVVPRSALQQQQQQPGDLRRAASAKALTSTDSRPAGWLGEDISNRSFNDLSIAAASRRKREPTEHVRTVGIPDTYTHYTNTNTHNETWDQVPPADESELLRRKRDKARESERRLRNEMQKSRSNRSVKITVSVS